jgi:ubiquinone/menaquinone biosynthesis C-methylase UbiE
VTAGGREVETKAHWEQVYREKQADELSWFQAEARLSLFLIQEAVPELESTIIDVGGGASTLADGLVAAGYRHMTVLDVSGEALRVSQERLDDRAVMVEWIEADLLTTTLPEAAYDLWHDRAVFHFLTSEDDRRQYVRQARHAVRDNGYVLVATFAEDGPTKCSGLDVVRYSPEALQSEFGGDFRVVKSAKEEHKTPRGATQSFTYCLCQLVPHEAEPQGS